MPDAKEIGRRLRELRGNRTLEEAANGAGVGQSALTMYELGQRIPRDEAKIRLAKYYGVTVDALFFASELHET